ncbi:DUF3341 domain-containing protein [bacterium]|nr:DUF3341 domain-containing protein [bacterium]
MTDDTANAKVCMYGLAAEFVDADSLKAAAQAARDAGYTKMSAYAPFYVEGWMKLSGASARSTCPGWCWAASSPVRCSASCCNTPPPPSAMTSTWAGEPSAVGRLSSPSRLRRRSWARPWPQ